MTEDVRRRTNTLAGDRGFTLIEVVVAASILIVGVLGVLSLLNAANRATVRTKSREAATNLAREAIEAGRAVPYPDLTPGNLVAQLQAQPGLADALPGAAWEIKRRGITYTVTATVCSVDDGSADGYGDHTGGFFCSDSATTGAADTNPDDYKRLAITVGWKNGSNVSSVKQEAVINNPGSAFAPAVRTLTANPAPPIVNTGPTPTTTSIAFAATTSTSAQQITWSVDGVERGTITGPATSFTFTWDLAGVVDGTYLVTVDAFDRYGESGASRTMTVKINRSQPAAPPNVRGSRNPLWNNLVELEWDPSPERDVIDYKVFRMKGVSQNPAGDDLICTNNVGDPNPTACQDTNAPGSNPKYYVVAEAPARSGSGLEYGALSSIVDTSLLDLRPIAPASVSTTCATPAGVQLSWPPGADLDGSIRYYRIYRDDNTSYTKRYDRTGTGADVTWTDTTPGAANHTYWVTAVDNQLSESTFAPGASGTTPLTSCP
jgi:Tfp pilus assembly protein PilV